MGIVPTKLPNKIRGDTGGGGGGGKARDQGEHHGTNTDPTLCGTSLRCTERSTDVREGAQPGLLGGSPPPSLASEFDASRLAAHPR